MPFPLIVYIPPLFPTKKTSPPHIDFLYLSSLSKCIFHSLSLYKLKSGLLAAFLFITSFFLASFYSFFILLSSFFFLSLASRLDFLISASARSLCHSSSLSIKIFLLEANCLYFRSNFKTELVPPTNYNKTPTISTTK